MSARNSIENGPVSPERLAEAAVWITRLHGGEHSPALESGFREWLIAHPMNRRAFELTAEVWSEVDRLRRAAPSAHEFRAARYQRRFLLPGLVALAAAILVAVGIAIFVRYEGVVTRVGEHRLLVLEDGTRVSLNTATRVVVRYDKHARTIELKRGEAFFDVAKRSSRPFIVQAGNRQVRALGTTFAVRRERDRTAITLIEGNVTVTAGELPGKPFTLVPGQRLTFDSHKAPAMDTPSLDTVIAWRRGEVVFDDTPLSVAVAEMNRYSDTRLIVERGSAATMPISGLFQAGDSVNFANAIARAYGLRISARRSEIIIGGLPETAPASQPR